MLCTRKVSINIEVAAEWHVATLPSKAEKDVSSLHRCNSVASGPFKQWKKFLLTAPTQDTMQVERGLRSLSQDINPAHLQPTACV